MIIHLSVICDMRKKLLLVVNHVLSKDRYLCMGGSVKEITLPISSKELVDALKEARDIGNKIVAKSVQELAKEISPIHEHLGVRNWSAVYKERKLVVLNIENDAVTIIPTLKIATIGFDYLPPIIVSMKNPEEVLSQLLRAIDISSTSSVNVGSQCSVNLPLRASWVAVKGVDPKKLAEDILDTDFKQIKCKEGLDIVSKDLLGRKAIIMPPVKGWTIAASFQAFADYFSDMDEVLVELSTKYNKAQAFAQDNVVEYYQWLQAVDGKMKRVFVYHGEVGGIIRQYGRISKIETSLIRKDESNEIGPDERSVGRVSEAWSIDPFIPRWTDNQQGYIGELSQAIRGKGKD